MMLGDKQFSRLKEVAGLSMPQVLQSRKILVQSAHSIRQIILRRWNYYEVHVIAHEAVPDQGEPVLDEVSHQQIKIDVPIVFEKENSLSVVSTLGDMVRPAGNNNTRSASHRS